MAGDRTEQRWQSGDTHEALVGMERAMEAAPQSSCGQHGALPLHTHLPAPMKGEESWLEGHSVINILVYTLTPCYAESTLVNLGLHLNIDSLSY